ncbi:MAG: amidohydrolase family protein [Sphingobium sp.]
MLIRNAEIWQRGVADLRIVGDKIADIGNLEPLREEDIWDAGGGAVLPGLHDHHIHLAALAVGRLSIDCGPPNVVDKAGLAEALAFPGTDWLRGIGYHESVAGMLEAEVLDDLSPARPVRIQHRSGRMWFFNSMALDLLLASKAPPRGLEQENGRWTGRLFDEDHWLREALSGTPPCFASVSAELGGMGVTSMTDLSPANDATMAAHFSNERVSGNLRQRVVLGGKLELADVSPGKGVTIGPAKLHLHENALPDIDVTIQFLRAAHAQGRAAAIHCTTETELVFALAALDGAGPMRGDRIEHAGVATDHLVTEMARMSLQVVTQPHFISERGDQYLRDVESRDQPFLYRLGALQRAGLIVAAGSDAPYGSCDPWASMRAAVSRRTAAGAIIGSDEEVTPEEALLLYLRDPHDLLVIRKIENGARADICVLDRPWREARVRLRQEDVRMTLVDGSIIYDCIDQTPF